MMCRFYGVEEVAARSGSYRPGVLATLEDHVRRSRILALRHRYIRPKFYLALQIVEGLPCGEPLEEKRMI
jgi:hypothetical protein